jgi:hypothetical protein
MWEMRKGKESEAALVEEGAHAEMRCGTPFKPCLSRFNVGAFLSGSGQPKQAPGIQRHLYNVITYRVALGVMATVKTVTVILG